MNILVVKLSAFGDIIHSLPALDDLLAHPEVGEVHWLVDARYRFVTEVFPSRVIVHEVAMKGPQPVRSAWQATRALRRFGFDAVLDLQGLIKSAVLARASGSPVYGIDTKYLREKPAGWLQKPTRFHAQDKHVVQQYRRVATAPFVDDLRRIPDAPLPYAAPRIHPDTLARLCDESILTDLGLAGRRYVVLHSASAWPTKRLPTETWIAIARGIIARGLVPVYPWGNDAERQEAHTLCSDGGGMLLPERMKMSALTTLLSKAEAILGADTGVLHLAAALGTPTVTFWGPTPSWRNSPMGEKDWHIESNPPCGPCIRRSCDQFICMPSISSDHVMEVIDELIAR